MALVIESFCVVLRCEVVEARWPGGVAGFARQAPNATFCTDGALCRVAFMSGDDARAWVARLADHGITAPTDAGAPDVTVYDDRVGSWFPCGWLDAGSAPYATPEGVVDVHAVWRRGRDPGAVAAPPGFVPGRVAWVSNEVLATQYERVSVEAGVETWRHRETGELRYVGRPPVTDGQRLSEAVDALSKAVWALAEPADRPLSPTEVLQLEAAIARARELEAALRDDPQPVLLRGVAARRLGRWRDAEAAFRRLTELRPDFVGGWLDLTWSLASQGRADEAVAAARQAAALQPDSPAALGNLAASLMERRSFEEAREVVGRALSLDPADAINLQIRGRLDELDPPRPWWKRLFGG